MSMKSILDTEHMHRRLTEFYYALENEPLIVMLVRDPLRPATKDGHFRTSPVVICTFLITVLAVGAFLFFSFGV